MSLNEHTLELTQKLQEEMLNLDIQACRDQAGKEQLKAVGQCHAGCGAHFPKGDLRKFCDKECAMDWEDEMRMEQRRTGQFKARSLIQA